MRTCTACKTPKSLDQYYRYANGKPMAVCKRCHCQAVIENERAKRVAWNCWSPRLEHR